LSGKTGTIRKTKFERTVDFFFDFLELGFLVGFALVCCFDLGGGFMFDCVRFFVEVADDDEDEDDVASTG
jgi:hypothetical protein